MANLRADNLNGTGGRNAIDGSVFFSGADRLQSATSSDFAFGTGAYTLEFWVKCGRASGENGLFGTFTSGAHGIGIWHNGANLYFEERVNGYAGAPRVTYSTFDWSNWNHLAMSRDSTSGTMRAFVNGVQVGTVTSSLKDLTATSETTIGHNGAAANNAMAYISNLRLNNTQLYTAAFTPPTEKLTAVAGTVLLCCQDSMNPEQEATGKTITGYGDLTVSDGVDLMTGTWTGTSTGSASFTGSGKYCSAVGTNLSNRGAGYMPCTVVVGKNYEFGFRTVAGITNCKIGVDSNDGTDDVRDAVGNNPDLVYSVGADSTTITGRKYRDTFTATTTTADIYFQGINGTVTADEIFLRLVDNSDKWRSNNEFPSVGVDEGVVFDGDTKVNSQGVMYFPTGDTSQRGRGRAVFAGGDSTGQPYNNAIEYYQLQTSGMSFDFGDLTVGRNQVRAAASSTRGVFAGGRIPSNRTDVIDYVTIATTSNAVDFGNLTDNRGAVAASSNSTRGVFMAGYNPGNLNFIDYITIASTGNAADFGDTLTDTHAQAGFASPTRGIMAGGWPGINVIEYVTIASTGNSTDFGDRVQTQHSVAGCSSQTRGIMGGGDSPAADNLIDYITIATTGNATDFGDLVTASTGQKGAASNQILGCFFSGWTGSAYVTDVQKVTIATTGNAVNFGSLMFGRHQIGATSDSHGGLS